MKRVVLTKWYEKSKATDEQNEFILNMLQEEDFDFLNLFNGESYYICFDKTVEMRGSRMFRVDIKDRELFIDGYTIPQLFTADEVISRRLGAIVQITMALLDSKEERIGGNDQSVGVAGEYTPKNSNKVYIKDYKYVYGREHVSTRGYRKLVDEFTVRGHFRTLKNGAKTLVKGYIKKFNK